MRIPKFEAQTEWVKPTEFPDLRQVDEIAIDLETKDPGLKDRGSGSVIGDGDVVGIAVATWVEEGVQGVHFGIKSSTLKTFASANGLRFLPPNNRDLSNKQLGQLITSGTVYLECHMTIAKIKKMIAEANNRKAFFSEYR